MPLHERIAFYSVANCAVVTATRDGMNLVPYEYVVCRQGPEGDEQSARSSMLVVSGERLCSTWSTRLVLQGRSLQWLAGGNLVHSLGSFISAGCAGGCITWHQLLPMQAGANVTLCMCVQSSWAARHRSAAPSASTPGA